MHDNFALLDDTGETVAFFATKSLRPFRNVTRHSIICVSIRGLCPECSPIPRAYPVFVCVSSIWKVDTGDGCTV